MNSNLRIRTQGDYLRIVSCERVTLSLSHNLTIIKNYCFQFFENFSLTTSKGFEMVKIRVNIYLFYLSYFLEI